MPKDIGNLSLKPQGIWERFVYLNLVMTQMHMAMTQTRMCQPTIDQNDELLPPHATHAPTSAYMEYQVEMNSLHLDQANVAQTHTHTQIKHAYIKM